MRHLIILANVNGTRLDPPRVVQRSALGSCDCRYVERRTPPRARPGYIRGRAQSARIPSWLKGGRNAPSSPPPNPICVRNVKIAPNMK